MSTLLMRLAGPMQSWGTQDRFSSREAGCEPSKSGVIGILCAALGRSRDEPVDDLARLSMGVRVDREGTIKNDFHTALNVLRADGKGIKECETSNRLYLSDAEFLVGIEGDGTFLRELHKALERPKWPICRFTSR